MNTLNSFRRNERGSSSLKAAAILAAWALVSPWAFSAPVEGDQPEAEPQTQKQVFERKVEVRTQSQPDGKVQTRIWVNGKEVQPENKEGEISLQITGDPSDCAECAEACGEAPCAPAECESAQAILEKVEAALRSAGMDSEPILNMLRETLKAQGDCPLKAPVPGEVQKDDLKARTKELEAGREQIEKARREQERMMKESREQMNRMLEKMGREPFVDWPAANINPRMLKMPVLEGDINARLERLEKRMQSLERSDAAVSPTMKELQRAARRIQNRVESKNMTAEEGLEKLLKRILGGQNTVKNSSQSEE